MNLPRGISEDQLVWQTKPRVWYRTPVYKGAHLQHREEDDIFWCGRTLWPTPDMIDTLPEPEWWVVEDTRKGGKCGECKRRDDEWADRMAWARALQTVRGRTPIIDPEADALVVHPDALPRVAQWMMADDSV